MGRMDKVNQQVKREISLIIQEEISDPRLQFVTINSVDVTKDLRNARVYFSVLGDEEKIKKAQESLSKAKGFIRKLIAGRLALRYTPELDFFYDRSVEFSSKINEALEEIKNESQRNSEID